MPRTVAGVMTPSTHWIGSVVSIACVQFVIPVKDAKIAPPTRRLNMPMIVARDAARQAKAVSVEIVAPAKISPLFGRGLLNMCWSIRRNFRATGRFSNNRHHLS